jgi:hypothetical protein
VVVTAQNDEGESVGLTFQEAARVQVLRDLRVELPVLAMLTNQGA